MNLLQLGPLVRRFRLGMEREEISLEASVKTLSYASELVLFKTKCLLPGLPGRDASEEDALEEGRAQAAAAALSVMEPRELNRGYRILAGLISNAGMKFPRGGTPASGPTRTLVVEFDVLQLEEAMQSMDTRSRPAQKTLLLPKVSFVVHLRNFWREVRRLAGQGVALRFSRFLGKTKSEAILNFLAFLELIKRRQLFARQRGLFDDILFSTAEDKAAAEEEVEAL